MRVKLGIKITYTYPKFGTYNLQRVHGHFLWYPFLNFFLKNAQGFAFFNVLWDLIPDFGREIGYAIDAII